MKRATRRQSSGCHLWWVRTRKISETSPVDARFPTGGEQVGFRAHLTRALGASGVSEDLLLDRHWRNARTLASHNPRVYKARILGDWLINGTDPLPNLAKLGRGGQGN